ncbi:MAG: hypothetical protein WCK65_10075 [Rhodospirillaceae bacterium]
MKVLSELLVIPLVMVLAMLLAFAPGPQEARAATAVAAESSAPDTWRPDDSALRKKPPFIDQNVVFLSCTTGASIGALVTGLPPVIGWIPYSGWPTQVSSLALRMGLGCYYGLVLGVAASGTYSVGRIVRETVRDTWNNMFKD